MKKLEERMKAFYFVLEEAKIKEAYKKERDVRKEIYKLTRNYRQYQHN